MEQTQTPRALADARAITLNPARYADRPSLLNVARIVAQSASGQTPRQARRPFSEDQVAAALRAAGLGWAAENHASGFHELDSITERALELGSIDAAIAEFQALFDGDELAGAV